MSEAERLEIPDEAAETDVLQETEAASASEEQPEPGMEAAAEVEISGHPEGVAPQEEDAQSEGTETKAEPVHGLSGATMESLSRTDEQSLANAEAERTKWQRRRAQMQERLLKAYRRYMDDGGFKIGISLVTAVVAASIIVIAGLFSDRMLSVIFWRALVGFCVSGVFMGGVLYWLDRFGIPLFIAKNEEQIQMEWMSEAEEPEQPGEEAAETSEEKESGELEELMPQGDESVSEEAADSTSGGDAQISEGEANQETTVGQEEENPQEQTESANESNGDMGGLENAVLDDAFSPEETEEEEKEEPPSFEPMSADNLESLSVPES